MLEYLLIGLNEALQPINLLMIFMGSFLGLLIGALPGLGPTVGVALLLPFCFDLSLSPVSTILLLTSLYQASEYGGSISSILLSSPGTGAAVATLLDGYPMCKRGYPGKALGYSLTASTIGGFIGVIVLILFSAPLASFALKFGASEYFALGILGLTMVATLSSKDILKSILSVVFGLLLTMIGIDIITGYPRFSFGRAELFEGIPLIPLLIGLFAVSEVYKTIGEHLSQKFVGSSKNLKVWITFKEIKSILRVSLIGGLIGSIVGIFPGLGGGPASWFSYADAKRRSKTPEEFGKGHPEGIAAPESANNASVGGALVPLLTLGIPGSPTAAVILGAFIIQGVQPGPQIFQKMPELVYGLFVGLLLATATMYILGLFTTNLLARMVILPNWFIASIILILACIGSYAGRHLVFDIWLMLLFGVVGYFLRKFEYSLPSILMAYILGYLIEANLRRTLLISSGSYLVLITRPMTLILLILSVVSLIFAVVREYKTRKRLPVSL